MNFPQEMTALLWRIPALLLAITFHEYAHGRVAYAFGDATAKYYGRLTLNPLRHLDPVGTIALLLFGFGWARPVPINPYNFRDHRSGMLWVALAGPLANFALALPAMFLLFLPVRLGLGLGLFWGQYFMFMKTLVTYNVLLGVFNLIPIPPLDGSKILTALAPEGAAAVLRRIEPYAPVLLLVVIFSGAVRWLIEPLFNAISGAMQAAVFLILGLS